MKLKEFVWTPGGGARPLRPLRSATDHIIARLCLFLFFCLSISLEV